MSKRVLVTGVGGFAGRYLSPILARGGYSVFGVAGHDHNGAVDGVDKTYTADLRQLASVREVVQAINPTHVVHLAAISFVGHEDIREIYDTNVVGTRNLLQALTELATSPQGVLLVSSANVYGNASVEVLSESDAVQPANDYAVSKIAMEYMSRQFNQRLPITTCRPFNYTGPGQSLSFLVPKIVDHFRRRVATIELGNLDIIRDFSDVRTVAEDMKKLIETPSAIGQVFNICSGRGHSLRDIIEICQKIAGYDISIEINPKFVRANEVRKLIGNPKKLNATVGLTAQFTLQQTLEWMLTA